MLFYLEKKCVIFWYNCITILYDLNSLKLEFYRLPVKYVVLRLFYNISVFFIVYGLKYML